MKNRFHRKILLRKMLTRTFRYKVSLASGAWPGNAAIDSASLTECRSSVARHVTSAKWLSALLPMQKRATILDKNKKNSLRLATDDSSERWWNWYWLYFHQLLSQSHFVSWCLSLTLSFSPTLPIDFATWQWKSALLLCGCSNNLSLNCVKDENKR